MAEISNIILENEMDLPLTHKRASTIAKLLKLSMSTQATFATAVSELCRAVIEKSLSNLLVFTLTAENGRWFLSAIVTTDSFFDNESEDLKYARRLIPVMLVHRSGNITTITLKLGLPRSLNIDSASITILKHNIVISTPLSPFDEVNEKNKELNNLADEREKQLRISNYLNEKKSEFLSIASHELKTPLTIIKSYAQMGKRFVNDENPKLGEILEKIDQQATKVNMLILQMLDLSKIENNNITYQLEKVQMNGFISDIINSVKSLHTSHRILSDLHANPEIYIDKLRIEQVIINLISNAAKYSNDGTSILVTMSTEADRIIVSVRDQGIGLSKENLAKVFDKFFRAEEVVQKVSGLGMGLYITSRIIKEHGGEIWAESELHKGSTFFFSLPIIASEQPS